MACFLFCLPPCPPLAVLSLRLLLFLMVSFYYFRIIFLILLYFLLCLFVFSLFLCCRPFCFHFFFFAVFFTHSSSRAFFVFIYTKTLFYALFNALYQSTPLPNILLLILGLSVFGWLIFVYLPPFVREYFLFMNF